MPGTDVTLGPFRGGLNTGSDPSAISDDELSVCINYDYEPDGSLTSRPSIVTATSKTYGGTQQTMTWLGCYVDSSTGTVYPIGCDGVKTYYLSSGVFTEIGVNLVAGAMVQYLDKAWLCPQPGSAVSGGSWDIGTGFTAVATIPRGNTMAVYKERIFVCCGPREATNSSRLYFSDIASGSSWPGTNFIDVKKGDGGKLNDIYVLGSIIYLFKTDATYMYSYDSRPDKGSVLPVSDTIGASGIYQVVRYQNTLVVYHENYVYELSNNQYTKLNVKCLFVAGSTSGINHSVTLSVVTDRVVIRFFDKIYVFNTITRTWGEWQTTRMFDKWMLLPRDSASFASDQFLSGNMINNTAQNYSLTDGFSSGNSEIMTCTMRTKHMDVAYPNRFKRLYGWAIDILCKNDVIGTIVPIAYSFTVTWGSLSVYTWLSRLDYLWGQPSSAYIATVDTVPAYGSYSRKLIRFNKAIRFRRIYFQVDTVNDGTTGTAPVKLFTVIPNIGIKERSPKQVN
jgi:hypothetical protein